MANGMVDASYPNALYVGICRRFHIPKKLFEFDLPPTVTNLTTRDSILTLPRDKVSGM